MSDDATNVVPMVSRAGRLSDALQRVRAREQARARDASEERESRLKSLADELRSMADELPSGEAGRFALVPSHNGERLTVDAQTHVDLDPETLDYQLVEQNHDGLDVIAHASDPEAMADSVADYIAERIVEREDLVNRSSQKAPPATASAPTQTVATQEAHNPSRFWVGFWWFVLGGVCSATALFTYAWLQAGPTG